VAAWLHSAEGDLENAVFDPVKGDTDVNTTSTYFEVEDADEPIARGRERLSDNRSRCRRRAGGVRTHGKSKDSRDDLPQIVSVWVTDPGPNQRSPASEKLCAPRVSLTFLPSPTVLFAVCDRCNITARPFGVPKASARLEAQRAGSGIAVRAVSAERWR
jgi:hypothetical protein